MSIPSDSDTSAGSLAEQLLTLWSDLPDALVVLDADWRYEYLNRAALALLKLQPDVVGSDARAVQPESFATPFGAAYRRVMDTRAPEVAEHQYGPSDSYLCARITPLNAGGLLIILTDTTEERRLRARLQDNLDLYQQVLDHMSQSITLRDLDSRYLLVNRTAAELVGRSKSEIVGRTPDDLFPPDVAAAIRASDLRVQSTGRVEDSPAAHALYPDRLLFPQIFPVLDRDVTDLRL